MIKKPMTQVSLKYHGKTSPGGNPAMSRLKQGKIANGELFDLAKAPISELIADLETEETLSDDGGAAPPRAEQIAGLILAEAIRLIRLGTRHEIARASNALAQMLIEEGGEELERRHPEAHRLVTGASVSLSAATPAASRGGAQTVLRSWSGKSREVLERLYEAPAERMRRAELRAKVGILDESHFSHLLSDLEGARLVVRAKTGGREVLVRLGPVAQSDEIRAMLIEPGPIFRSKAELTGRHSAERKNRLGHEPTLTRLETILSPPYENESFAGAQSPTTLTICRLTSLRDLDQGKEESPFAGAFASHDRSLQRSSSD
jgi:hypothetical protein